eukprot:6667060-Alexandrium_andersonii.AAC.1
MSSATRAKAGEDLASLRSRARMHLSASARNWLCRASCSLSLASSSRASPEPCWGGHRGKASKGGQRRN